MKHRYLLLSLAASLLLFPALMQAQIANPGFETWTNNQPDGWFTYSLIFNDISKSTTAHSGSASLKASVVLINNVPTGGIIQSGAGAQGFPVNARNGSVNGYYQFSPTGGDRFVVAVIMYAGAAGSTTAIGAGDVEIATATGSSWAQFSVPITYIDNTTVPQTVYIQMAITGPQSSGDPHVGSFYLIDDISLGGVTVVGDKPSAAPLTYALEQNYPNPFNPSTTIRYSVPKETYVTLTVFDLLGQEIRTLVDASMPAGTYRVMWNGTTNSGALAGSGLYFCRIRAGEFSDMKRMMLVK